MDVNGNHSNYGSDLKSNIITILTKMNHQYSAVFKQLAFHAIDTLKNVLYSCMVSLSAAAINLQDFYTLFQMSTSCKSTFINQRYQIQWIAGKKSALSHANN
jgi:hypothetical protein